jgi:hypothetical protein
VGRLRDQNHCGSLADLGWALDCASTIPVVVGWVVRTGVADRRQRGAVCLQRLFPAGTLVQDADGPPLAREGIVTLNLLLWDHSIRQATTPNEF